MESGARQPKKCIDLDQNKNDIRPTLQKQGHLSSESHCSQMKFPSSFPTFFFTYSPFSSTTLFFVLMPLATKHPQCNPINLKCYMSSSLPTELFCLLEPVNIYVQFVCICHFTLCCVRVFETILFYVFLKGREIQSQTVFIVNAIKCTTSSHKQDLTHCCLASGSKLTRNIKGRGCERKTM